jgi:integrase
MPTKDTKERGIYEKVPGTGIWWTRWTDSEGKLHRELAGTIGNARKRIAERRAEKMRGQAPMMRRQPKPQQGEVLQFGELITDALAYSGKNNDKRHTHELSLKFKKMAELGKMPAASVTRNRIQDFLDEQSNECEWSGSTYNRALAAFSLIFRVAIENEKLPINPVHGIRRKQENNARVRFLSQDEETALTSAIRSRSPEYLPVYLLAMHSGMRLSEQLRAQVGDYTSTTGMLMIRQKKVRSAPATRYVPLTPIAVQAYNQLAAKKKTGEPLCTNTEGAVLYEARYWFDPAVDEAGVVDLTWHCLRHTAASRWVMSGVPIAVVSRYLGHSSVNQTMVYSHLQPDNAARAVAAMMSYYPEPRTGTEKLTPAVQGEVGC